MFRVLGLRPERKLIEMGCRVLAFVKSYFCANRFS